MENTQTVWFNVAVYAMSDEIGMFCFPGPDLQ